MKANNKMLMKKDTSAQAGIGTLIIFIAMVLVAAVAAAVLIQTSGVLQQKAQSTGTEVSEEISSNLKVESIEGIRAKDGTGNLSDTIDLLKMKVSLNIGSAEVDLNQLVISIGDGTNSNDLNYAGNTMLYGTAMDGFSATDPVDTNLGKLLNNTHSLAGKNVRNFFIVQKMRDEDGSFSYAQPVMNAGDLVTIYIATVSSDATSLDYLGNYNASAATLSLQDSGLTLDTRSTVNIQLLPEKGTAAVVEFNTPTSYGVKESYSLYP